MTKIQLPPICQQCGIIELLAHLTFPSTSPLEAIDVLRARFQKTTHNVSFPSLCPDPPEKRVYEIGGAGFAFLSAPVATGRERLIRPAAKMSVEKLIPGHSHGFKVGHVARHGLVLKSYAHSIKLGLSCGRFYGGAFLPFDGVEGFAFFYDKQLELFQVVQGQLVERIVSGAEDDLVDAARLAVND